MTGLARSLAQGLSQEPGLKRASRLELKLEPELSLPGWSCLLANHLPQL